MKKTAITVGILTITVVLVLSSVVVQAGKDETGSGAPSGKHYNLNLIGVKDDHPKKMPDCDSGNRIFVKLGRKGVSSQTKINLTSCEEEGYGADCMDFAVLDCDGTDGDASFMLPNPDPTNSGTTRYSVYIRLLGKPGGKIDMRTCGTVKDGGEYVCSDLVIELTRTKGKQTFQNVSKQLLYIYADYNGDGNYDRVPLFHPDLEGYLWEYDSYGAKLAQLRFYPGVETRVPDPLKSISPWCGEPNSLVTLPVTLEAYPSHPNYEDFSAGVDDVSFGDGITVDSYVVVDNDTIVANIIIDDEAEEGTRIVTVTLVDGIELIIPFDVDTSCP